MSSSWPLLLLPLAPGESTILTLLDSYMGRSVFDGVGLYGCEMFAIVDGTPFWGFCWKCGAMYWNTVGRV